MSKDRQLSAATPRHVLVRGKTLCAHTSIPTMLLLLSALTVPHHAQAACGCTGITVSHTDGQTMSICSNADINVTDPDNGFPECKKIPGPNHQCGKYSFRYDCPIGVNSVSNQPKIMQRTGFLVDAQLTGTPSQCKSGHALQLTITGDQVSRPKVHGTPDHDVSIGGVNAAIVHDQRRLVPELGETSGKQDLFGADSYTDPKATDSLIQQDAGSTKWWDNTDQRKDDHTEHATWAYRYLSYIIGTDSNDSCACVYDIKVDWQPHSKGAKTTWAKDNKKSSHCTVTP
ncbi:hypothetical protein ABIB82_001904 [Bradyrhizobium sp. i1.8.4]|uniref:hypothetical protein n=1 Tax=unclassified Bradyrhizobium TaxID=2631580 RepID=UPI003D20D898